MSARDLWGGLALMVIAGLLYLLVMIMATPLPTYIHH